MGTRWVCQWLLFFTLVGQGRHICCHAVRKGLFSWSSTSLWQQQSHHLELHYPVYSFLASVFSTLCLPLSALIPSQKNNPSQLHFLPWFQMCYFCTQNWYFRCCSLSCLSFSWSFWCLAASGFAGLCSPKMSHTPLQLIVEFGSFLPNFTGAPCETQPFSTAPSNFCQLLASVFDIFSCHVWYFSMSCSV